MNSHYRLPCVMVPRALQLISNTIVGSRKDSFIPYTILVCGTAIRLKNIWDLQILESNIH